MSVAQVDVLFDDMAVVQHLWGAAQAELRKSERCGIWRDRLSLMPRVIPEYQINARACGIAASRSGREGGELLGVLSRRGKLQDLHAMIFGESQ